MSVSLSQRACSSAAISAAEYAWFFTLWRMNGSAALAKSSGAHIADIVGVEVGELFDVKDGGGLGDARDVEGLGQLRTW